MFNVNLLTLEWTGLSVHLYRDASAAVTIIEQELPDPNSADDPKEDLKCTTYRVYAQVAHVRDSELPKWL